MARPVLLQSSFDRGVVKDLPRHLLPQGAVWESWDFIPNLEGVPLAKRGGWLWASPGLGAGGYVAAVSWAPFVSGAQKVAITNTGELWKVTNPSAATDIGAAAVPVQRPVFFNDLLIIPAAIPKKYNGTTVANLGGTPPGGLYGGSFASRLMLAGTSANPNRVFFSDILDPETWNTANSYVDVTDPITGVAVLRNAILFFSDGSVDRVRGSIPPPGGDFALDSHVFNQGCIDARSIVQYGDRVIWANANGIWMTDGAATPVNLVAQGGILQYWIDLMSGWTSAWVVACGVYQGKLFVSVTDPAGTFKFRHGMFCDLDRRAWFFLQNFGFTMFAESEGDIPELFGSQVYLQNGGVRICSLSSMFSPSSANVLDGDGTSNGSHVVPLLDLPFYRGTPGSRRWKNLWIGTKMQDSSAGGTAQINILYVDDPADVEDDYTYLVEDDGATPRSIGATAAYSRTKIPFHLASSGFGLRLTQTFASNYTQIFDIEADVIEREPSRG